jgi:cell wall-associated NlpC family hydrolase
MTFQAKLFCAVAVTGFAAFAATAPANALSTQECSAKYQAAKKDGSLNGQKWNDFRKAQCAADAAPAATPAAAPSAAPAAPTTSTAAKKEAAPAAAPAPVATGNAMFPSAVDSKYASEKPHIARMHTCSDQWKANKANNTTGGMHWNPKGGGGFYPECNKRLKGPA